MVVEHLDTAAEQLETGCVIPDHLQFKPATNPRRENMRVLGVEVQKERSSLDPFLEKNGRAPNTRKGFSNIITEQDLRISTNCASRDVTAEELLSSMSVPLPTFENANPSDISRLRAEYVARLKQELSERFGLESLHFKIYTTWDGYQRGFDIGTALNNRVNHKLHVGLNEKDMREGVCYEPQFRFLIGGWTSDASMWELPEGESIIKQILAKNPNAIVIAVDPNGFGKSKYKDGLSQGELVDKVSVKNAADQIEWLATKILGLTEQQLIESLGFGHSMGGAIMIELVKRGYFKGKKEVEGKSIAVTPAMLIPAGYKVPESVKTGLESIRTEDPVFFAELVKEFPKIIKELYDTEPDDDDDIFRNFQEGFETPEITGIVTGTEYNPKNPHIRGVYAALSVLIYSGAIAEAVPLLDKIADPVTKAVFDQMLADRLMGAKKPEDVKRFSEILAALKKTHGEVLLQKKLLSAAVMFVLAKGVDPEAFLAGADSVECAQNISDSLTIIEGEFDNLGGGPRREYFSEAVRLAACIKARRVIQKQETVVLKDAGHCSPVYSVTASNTFVNKKKA